MTPDEVRGGYAAVLMISEGTSKMQDVPDVVAWHQRTNLWLSSTTSPRLHRGMPVVARVAGESNELVLLGTVAGDWEQVNEEFHTWKWDFQIPVAWETHVVRGVYALDVLGELGKSRPAIRTISRGAWQRVVNAMLDA
jgi:hypothetical protein